MLEIINDDLNSTSECSSNLTHLNNYYYFLFANIKFK